MGKFLKAPWLVFVTGVFVFSISFAQGATDDQACFAEKCVNVEVAQTPDMWLKGLQNRESLDQNSGMLFIFEVGRRQGFWMKDTLIPLDIIWLNEEKRVVHIEHNAPPCQRDKCKTYMPIPAALYVLEINGGDAEKLNINIGDVAELKLTDEKDTEIH